MNSKEKKFAKVLMKLRSEEEVLDFLATILTFRELENIHQRWRIFELLSQGQVYKDIERQTGASSATIAKINQMLREDPGILKRILSRLK